MKEILAVITILVASVLGEPPAAPYPASGWRPNGPAFELPQKNSQNPNQLNSYGVPLQQQYGVPDDSISVQGLPIKEQRPLFVLSPINGQQYVGSNLNTDIRNLNENFKETQFQKQQETFRTISRERELNTRTRQQNNIGVPSLQTPRQFQTSTYPSITEPTKTTGNTNDPTDNFRFTEPEQITANPSNDEKDATYKKKTENPVEITKQNLQEIAPEIYLSPLTQQISLQQLGQLRAPVFYQPNAASIPQFNQKLIASNFGYDGPLHLAALQSILSSQNQGLAPAQLIQNQNQGSLEQMPSMVLVNKNEEQENVYPEQQFNQQQPLYPQQLQPVLVRNQGFISQNQYQQSREYLQPNLNTPQQNESNDNDNEYNKNYTPQFIINPPQVYQPQEVQYPQQFYTAPEQNANDEQGHQNQMAFANQYQIQYRPELVQYQPGNQNLVQYYQNQMPQQNQNGDTRNNFQDNQGNDLEQTEKDSTDEDDSSVTAVATAFGNRTSPRVFNQYGVPKSDVDPRSTAEPTESSTDDNPVAEATAVSKGGKRKSANLRNRRIRPLFTLDRSGHLVLVNNQ